MQEVIPFADRFELQEAIDNGGRFYNIFSKAGDSIVTKGELAKAAGVCGADHRAILFLELAKWDLDAYDQSWTLDLLEPKLHERYETFKPVRQKPSEVESAGTAGSVVALEGYPQFLTEQTEPNGFITVPIMIGNVTTFSMVPIHQNYDLYELYDGEAKSSESCLLAVAKADPFEHAGPIRVGGLLRELQSQDKPPTHQYYLEGYYYTKLGHPSE